MKHLVLATQNEGKIREFRQMARDLPLELKTLADYGLSPHIVEDGASFLENALKKAQAVAAFTGEAALADDSGLEVDFLAGAPGIHSSCYAGVGASDESNISRLLRELQGVPPARRVARFVCVLVLARQDGTYESFAGFWPGIIAEEPRGENGFGYDPVFYLPEWGKTAAELTPEEKNRLSHRAQAMQKLRDYLADKCRQRF